MHSCCPFIVLLFVVQFEFEFELNVFESFQKWKSLYPFLFSAQSAHLSFLPLPFSFLFRGPNSPSRRPTFPLPRSPARCPLPFLSLPPTCGPRLSGSSPSRERHGLKESGRRMSRAVRALRSWPARQGALLHPYLRCRNPLNPIESSRRLLVLAQP